MGLKVGRAPPAYASRWQPITNRFTSLRRTGARAAIGILPALRLRLLDTANEIIERSLELRRCRLRLLGSPLSRWLLVLALLALADELSPQLPLPIAHGDPSCYILTGMDTKTPKPETPEAAP